MSHDRIYIHLNNDVDEYELANEPERFGEPVWTRELSPEFIEEYMRVSQKYDEMRHEISKAVGLYFERKAHARETMELHRLAKDRGLALVPKEES
jgi:hypothetical protein